MFAGKKSSVEPTRPVAIEYKSSYAFKLAVLGGEGKTSLISRFADNNYTAAYYHTIGVDFKQVTANVNGNLVQHFVYDGVIPNITKNYTGYHGILLVVDLTNKVSLDHAKECLDSLSKTLSHILLVATKTDLTNDYAIHDDDLRAFVGSCQADFPQFMSTIIKTSAKNDINVDAAFYLISNEIIKLIQSPIVSSKQKIEVIEWNFPPDLQKGMKNFRLTKPTEPKPDSTKYYQELEKKHEILLKQYQALSSLQTASQDELNKTCFRYGEVLKQYMLTCEQCDNLRRQIDGLKKDCENTYKNAYKFASMYVYLEQEFSKEHINNQNLQNPCNTSQEQLNSLTLSSFYKEQQSQNHCNTLQYSESEDLFEKNQTLEDRLKFIRQEAFRYKKIYEDLSEQIKTLQDGERELKIKCQSLMEQSKELNLKLENLKEGSHEQQSSLEKTKKYSDSIEQQIFEGKNNKALVIAGNNPSNVVINNISFYKPLQNNSQTDNSEMNPVIAYDKSTCRIM